VEQQQDVEMIHRSEMAGNEPPYLEAERKLSHLAPGVDVTCGHP
jgi:hypothetical protein